MIAIFISADAEQLPNFLINYWKVRGADGAARVLDLNPTILETKMNKLGIKRPASN